MSQQEEFNQFYRDVLRLELQTLNGLTKGIKKTRYTYLISSFSVAVVSFISFLYFDLWFLLFPIIIGIGGVIFAYDGKKRTVEKKCAMHTNSKFFIPFSDFITQTPNMFPIIIHSLKSFSFKQL